MLIADRVFMDTGELQGTTIAGDYRVGPQVASGGTGVLHEVERIADGEFFVLKTLRSRFRFHPELVTRLQREAEVSEVVRHPGIVGVVDHGVLPDASPFIVMEWVHGEGLHELLHRVGPLSAEQAAMIAYKVASILDRVHASGYVHRDIKPEHIYLETDIRGNLKVRLLDFGVCASVGAPHEERERERGRVFGTPSYVSPEQATGEPYVDARADIYGLGVVMFEALAGKLPFAANDVMALLRTIIRQDAPRLTEVAPFLDTKIAVAVQRMLARDPSERPASARALRRALLPLLRNRMRVEQELVALSDGSMVSNVHLKDTFEDEFAA